MHQTKIGYRVVAIAGTAHASGNAARLEPAKKRIASRRIVVIRNGEFVGGGPGR